MNCAEYPKINSIFKRDPDTHKFFQDFAIPELEYLAFNEWDFRGKIDGTNIRVSISVDEYEDWHISFFGRTDKAQTPKPLLTKLTDLFAIYVARERIKQTFDLKPGDQVTLYGEGYGAGIQKGGDYGPINFILFDVKIGDTWLLQRDVEQIAKSLEIEHAPILGSGTLPEAVARVRNPEGHTGFWAPWYDRWPQKEPEGLVVVPKVPLFDRRGHRIITKVKLCDFVD